MHSRRASYDDITRSSAVQAKVKALRRGASADLSDLCTWGETQNLSRICLVRATPQNTFTAQLIYVKSKIVLCTDSSYASGDLSIDLSAVPLKKTAWVLAERLRSGSCTPTILDRDATLEPEMVFVKGGKFTMGCVDGRDNIADNFNCEPDESPAHEVRLSSFWIGRYEVTRAQWHAVMKGFPRPQGYPSGNETTTPRHPVMYVQYSVIKSYLAALNAKLKEAGIDRTYRLPTEAEWEYAARGGTKSQGYQYSGSNTASSVAQFGLSHDNPYMHEVGGKSANELGIHDMSGNVFEWCSDYYSDNYYSAISGGATNPKGPDSCNVAVRRGGGSWYYAFYCRVADRHTANFIENYTDTGFRVVLDLP
jgi:formylglycine-generating enzyme required for sulfatase activity